MKLGNGITIDWSIIGATLANEDDEVQIKFFKGFCKQVDSWPTVIAKDVQMLRIRDGLNDKEKEIISGIVYKGE